MLYSLKCYFLYYVFLPLSQLTLVDKLISLFFLYSCCIPYCKISKYFNVFLFSLVTYMEIAYYIHSSAICFFFFNLAIYSRNFSISIYIFLYYFKQPHSLSLCVYTIVNSTNLLCWLFT